MAKNESNRNGNQLILLLRIYSIFIKSDNTEEQAKVRASLKPILVRWFPNYPLSF